MQAHHRGHHRRRQERWHRPQGGHQSNLLDPPSQAADQSRRYEVEGGAGKQRKEGAIANATGPRVLAAAVPVRLMKRDPVVRGGTARFPVGREPSLPFSRNNMASRRLRPPAPQGGGCRLPASCRRKHVGSRRGGIGHPAGGDAWQSRQGSAGCRSGLQSSYRRHRPQSQTGIRGEKKTKRIPGTTTVKPPAKTTPPEGPSFLYQGQLRAIALPILKALPARDEKRLQEWTKGDIARQKKEHPIRYWLYKVLGIPFPILIAGPNPTARLIPHFGRSWGTSDRRRVALPFPASFTPKSWLG